MSTTDAPRIPRPPGGIVPRPRRAPMPAQSSTYELTATELRNAQPLEFGVVAFLAIFRSIVFPVCRGRWSNVCPRCVPTRWATRCGFPA